MFRINKKFKKAIGLLIMILVLILVDGCSKQQAIINSGNKQRGQEHDDPQGIMVREEQNEEDVIPQKDKQSEYIDTASQIQTEMKNKRVVEASQQHNHNWVPQTQTRTHKEVGHFETRVVETVYAWRTFCNKCGEDITDLGVEGITIHSAVLCESGYHNDYAIVETKTEQVWVIDNPAYTEAIITGYVCSCGETKK